LIPLALRGVTKTQQSYERALKPSKINVCSVLCIEKLNYYKGIQKSNLMEDKSLNELLLEIPKQVENLQLPNPELLSYYRDLEQRTIWIDYEIDQSVMEIVKKILAWNKEDVGKSKDDMVPIRLLIFSPGGDLQSALSLIDVVKMSRTPVWGFNMGDSSSASLLILLSCHRRSCLRGSTALLHAGSGYFGGTASQVDNSTGYYKAQLEKIKGFVLANSQIDVKTYNKKKDIDWYMDSDEQEKYGIATPIDDITAIIG
jgi:ATP-dependent protease ClpP protease subunit